MELDQGLSDDELCVSFIDLNDSTAGKLVLGFGSVRFYFSNVTYM